MKKRGVRWGAFALVIPMLALWVLQLAGCSDDHGHSHGSQPSGAGDTSDNAADHGTEVQLGNLTVASREFSVLRLGDLVPGRESAFEVRGVGISQTELAKLNLYLWVEDESGVQLSAPAKGNREGQGLHFHVTARAGKGQPHRVVLRLRTEGVDERSSLPLDGHGHEHEDGPHHGILAAFHGVSRNIGFLELKLHDDKGDLELWLAQDSRISTPFDLPLDAEVEVEFIDVSGRKVPLRARNRDQNEDENGKPNVRQGGTNYFIFPSSDEHDARWLRGKEFSSIVRLRFSRSGEDFESEEFVLKPHTH